MSGRPIGEDGFPMENHHQARMDQEKGDDNLIMRTTHQLIHADEIAAVKGVFESDGLSGRPNSWTAKILDKK
jgi:hypothetical protein